MQWPDPALTSLERNTFGGTMTSNSGLNLQQLIAANQSAGLSRLAGLEVTAAEGAAVTAGRTVIDVASPMPEWTQFSMITRQTGNFLNREHQKRISDSIAKIVTCARRCFAMRRCKWLRKQKRKSFAVSIQKRT
jgi:hypothetical protein